MNFKALEAELDGDFEQLDRLTRPKRKRKKADVEIDALAAPMGPGRHVVLGESQVVLRAVDYLCPDGMVRQRARLPGGYTILSVREATAGELALAEAPTQARPLRPLDEEMPLEVGGEGGGMTPADYVLVVLVFLAAFWASLARALPRRRGLS